MTHLEQLVPRFEFGGSPSIVLPRAPPVQVQVVKRIWAKYRHKWNLWVEEALKIDAHFLLLLFGAVAAFGARAAAVTKISEEPSYKKRKRMEIDFKAEAPQRSATKLLRYRSSRMVRGSRRPYKKPNKSAATNVNRNLNLYYFKRKVAPGRQVNLTTNPNGTIQFSLDQVPGVADFTALFDQYKITGVKVDFRLILDPSAAAAGSATYPNLYVRKDYDNTTAETIQEIAQDNRSKRFILQPNRVCSVFVKPALQAEYFNTGSALTDKSPVWNRWFDCSNTSMQHLGLKWAIDTMGILLTQGVTMTIEFTYYLEMKNTR